MVMATTKTKGFTLVELVTVIIVLGVVSVGISGFIRTGMDIYTDVNERDQLLGESRFVVERLSRELRGAIPNSARLVSAGNTQCLEFVPALWTTYYTSLSVFPDLPSNLAGTTTANVVELAASTDLLPLQGNEFAVVYPTTANDIYAAIDLNNHDTNKRLMVNSCTDEDGDCSTADANATDPHLAILTLSREAGTAQLTAFSDHSPASRMYFARQAVSYCAHSDGDITRHVDGVNSTQTAYASSMGVLMAKGLSNSSPFTVTPASLTRNALVSILLIFERNDEVVNYNIEVHIPNVP